MWVLCVDARVTRVVLLPSAVDLLRCTTATDTPVLCCVARPARHLTVILLPGTDEGKSCSQWLDELRALHAAKRQLSSSRR
jgi:hypothetical protein